MIIEWYTVIFQIINFLILVFLLRYFLYGPIIRAMDEREQKIVQREEEAVEQKKEAAKESHAYRQKSEQLQQQEAEIMEKAHAAAAAEKLELLQKARQAVEETRHRWEDAFTREQETFISELRRRIGQQACSIARRCLQDLADARLEELTWDLFLKKIGKLPEEKRSALRKALSADGHKLALRSAFDPPAEKLNQLKSSLREVLSDLKADFTVSAKIDPALVCGLELDVGGYRVAWSVGSYLEGVEKQIFKELEQDGLREHTEEVSGGGKAGD
jgi:F-type H+-transporting ATPase subunit b